MNAKKAKAMRAAARKATVGMPERSYLQHRKTKQVVVNQMSTRGIAKSMKRAARRAV